MTKRKISIAILMVCIVLIVSALCGCNGKRLPKEIKTVINDNFDSEDVTILYNLGQYDDCYFVLVESEEIDSTLRIETINGVRFKYAANRQIFVVNSERMYTIKGAYLNLVIGSAILSDVRSAYYKAGYAEYGGEYTEIGGRAVVLEQKKVFDETLLDQVEHVDNKVSFLVDNNFVNYRFTANDFPTIEIESFECLTEGVYNKFQGNIPTTFHDCYYITLKQGGDDNLLKAIRTLEQYEFVKSADFETYGYLID